ncbi:helix-turn-helix transcriptional regulator [Spirosoma sp. KUDC1026]|uniref:helix-turn-helix transcriptional regulator n=1 Tax=Spirosoma sp. KUDC1026 TaxID=2745947 RepID=UPI00159BC7C0|nr:WYL domain-containing protein [Spirosoma sp. KUDC1026]QKZ14671.1 WYL domain-containing protein [Spirosoma sp. KUDC1026]
MPVVKDREERLKRINDRLKRWNGHPVSTSELARHCNISESMIKKDIAYMKVEYNAPINYNHKLRGYYYMKPFELAATVTLTDKDLATLHRALATLQQFQHLSLFDDLRGTVDKLDKAVRFRSSLADDFGKYILFESVPYTKGSEWVEVFLQAIHQRQVVQFQHQRYDTEVTKTHQIYPYVVKEHRNRWYVVGWRLDDKQIRVFGLDRIIPDSIKQLTIDATPPDFDAEAYLRKALGVAVYDGPAEAVMLSFTREQGFRFRAQPFYPFRDEDILVDTETELQIRLDIVVNRELVYELARLGNQVKVLEPAHLRDDLTAFLSDALDQY